MRYKDMRQKELVGIWNTYHHLNQDYPRIIKCAICSVYSYRYPDSKDCRVCYDNEIMSNMSQKNGRNLST